MYISRDMKGNLRYYSYKDHGTKNNNNKWRRKVW